MTDVSAVLLRAALSDEARCRGAAQLGTALTVEAFSRVVVVRSVEG